MSWTVSDLCLERTSCWLQRWPEQRFCVMELSSLTCLEMCLIFFTDRIALQQSKKFKQHQITARKIVKRPDTMIRTPKTTGPWMDTSHSSYKMNRTTSMTIITIKVITSAIILNQALRFVIFTIDSSWLMLSFILSTLRGCENCKVLTWQTISFAIALCLTELRPCI